MTNRQKFLETNSGRELLQRHQLTETGTWQIYGDDLGGECNPLLDTVEGTLDDAITFGVDLTGFWNLGDGGDFKKITVRCLDPVKLRQQRMAELSKRQVQLSEELHKVNAEMRRLDLP